MAACSGRSASGVRTRAVLAVMYRAGLRISEVLDLRPKDVDLAAGTVRVLCGKGEYPRTVGIDPGAGAVVAAGLVKREGLDRMVIEILDARPAAEARVAARGKW